MFYPKAKTMVSGADKLTAQAREASAAAAGRARDATSTAAQTAAQTAQAAAQTVAQAATAAAQTAAEAASESVRKGVFSARGWVAPRLENAADYTTDTVAPKVSSVLRDTARQISPPDSRQQDSRPVLRWSLLATAAFAAAGAALLVRQRYRAGMAAHTDNTETPTLPEPAMGATTGAESTTPAGSAPVNGTADTGVNGKVSTPG